MNVIIRGRDSGKAVEIFELAMKENAYILTTNKEGLQVKAESYGYPLLKIIDYKDIEEGNFYRGEPVIIHNADKFLKWLFSYRYGLDCIGFSATKGE